AYSERFKEMCGYPTQVETAALPEFRELVHPDEVDEVYEDFVSQLRERSVPNAVRRCRPSDLRLRCTDGSYLWVHAEGMAVCGADGRTLRLVLSFIDISTAKRHEIEMANRIKFIGDVFDSLPSALALRDSQGRSLLVNLAWERHAGVSRDSVVGASLRDVLFEEADAT